MKRIRRVRDHIILHPVMSFFVMILITIVLSGILNFFNVSTTYNKITASGSYESVLVSVDSLFNLSGIKYIFSN